MESLKATQAREIDKASVTEAETLVVNNEVMAKVSEPAMQAGDFYFKPNVVTTNSGAPTGCFKRLVWKLKGSPATTTDRIIYTVVISCPFCGLPIMTGFSHHIASKNPLTIVEPIACPYSSQDSANAHAFRITEGNITIA
jgi:hypothetical protein